MMNEIERIEAALSALQPAVMAEENGLHGEIARLLREAGIPCMHEYRLGPGCRVDFLCGSTALEIKKGKPQAAPLIRQIGRYLASEEVTGILVILQRSVRLPETIGGKPVRQLPLDRNWGVSLP